MKGVKHLIQCHCILPQYRNIKEPVFHKFPVFSVIDESDTVIVKYAECNNCGAAHKIYDLCKSEIVMGKDEVRTQLTFEDFKHSFPDSLYDLLIQYNKDLSDFEYAQFILDNKEWNSHLVLTREEIDGHTQGKILKFIDKEKFRVESYTSRLVIKNENR